MLPGEAEPEAYLHALEERGSGTIFVHGRGKRKTQLQRDIETLREYLSRKAKYAGYSATFKGRNSFSKTDPDATFMRMKEDHMKNGQLKPGYNLQLGVEGGYIVGVDISSERSDEWTLLSLLKRMDAGLHQRHKAVVADAGYESEENYTSLEEREQIAYIKPQNYEKSKTRKYRNNAYLRENMPYDPQNDTYTCLPGTCSSRNMKRNAARNRAMRLPLRYMNTLAVKHAPKESCVPAPRPTAGSKSPRPLSPSGKLPLNASPV